MQVNLGNIIYKETEYCRIDPLSFKYSRGVHTINFHEGLCVVDGYGYLYQVLGRLFNILKKVKALVK